MDRNVSYNEINVQRFLFDSHPQFTEKKKQRVKRHISWSARYLRNQQGAPPQLFAIGPQAIQLTCKPVQEPNSVFIPLQIYLPVNGKNWSGKRFMVDRMYKTHFHT